MAKETNKEELGSMSGGGPASKYIFLFLFLILLASFGWYFMKYRNAQQQIAQLSSEQGRQELNQKEIDDIVAKVAKHIVLPEGETPTVATIEDAQALAEQQNFFVGAENGDKVLIYSNKAFIYNPTKDMLVNVGPVYFQNNEEATTETTEETTSTTEEDATVEEVVGMSLDIRNGSETLGRAQSLANDLKSKGDYNVVSIVNAAKNDYSGMILVNLSGGDVSALEQSLGVSAVSSLPDGEAGSSADVVIIIGNE